MKETAARPASPVNGIYMRRFDVARVAPRLRAALAPLAVPMPDRRPVGGPRGRPAAWLGGLTFGAGLGGLALLTRVALRPTPSRLDVTMTRLLQRRQPDVITWGMTLISAPGFAPLQHVLTCGTALDLWALDRRRESLFTMLTMGAGAITGVIKIAVGRPRPDPAYMRRLVRFRDNSFPSGHCAHYASFYGFLFYLAWRGLPPSSLRRAILLTCAGLIVLVAPSRVYLGHHWQSDVLAGDLVGLTYLCLLIAAYERVGVRAGL